MIALVCGVPAGLKMERVGIFGLGMHRELTLLGLSQTLGLQEISGAQRWPPQVEFVSGVNKSRLNVKRMIRDGLVSPWAFTRFEHTQAQFGLAGRSHRDAFMLANVLAHRKVYQRVVDRGLPAAFVFEDDAVLTRTLRQGLLRSHLTPADLLRETLQNAERLDPEWDLINMGRCYDLCSLNNFMQHPDKANVIASTGQLFITSPQSMCLHAYAVSARGARKMLSLTLPFVYPIDLLTPLLSRAGLLNYYSITPLTFQQRDAVGEKPTGVAIALRHRSKGGLPECDPTEHYAIKHVLVNGSSTWDADLRAVLALGGSWVSHFTPAAQDCPNVFNTIAKDQTEQNPGRCDFSAFQCEFVSSQSAIQSGVSGTPHLDTTSMLQQMDSLGLRGAVIWGLRSKESDIHGYELHRAVHSSLKYAFAQTSTPRHLCWATGEQMPRGCSLDTLLGYEDAPRAPSEAGEAHVLGRSLVFASPKHMPRSLDWALTSLPVDWSSAYIFHEVMPARFSQLVQVGRVVQWRTGADSGPPHPINTSYLVLAAAEECSSWPCTHGSTANRPATMVSALASKLTPADVEQLMAQLPTIAATRARRRTVAFSDSAWRQSVEGFCAFAVACRVAGIHVVLSSAREVRAALGACSGRRSVAFSSKVTPDQRAADHSDPLPHADIAPFLHLDHPSRVKVSGPSYFPAEAFDAAARGQLVATNNPVVARLLLPIASEAIVFAENATDLCGRAAVGAQLARLDDSRRLQRFIWAEHTYVSRLNSLLKLLQPPPAVEWAEHSAHSATAALTFDASAVHDAAWCSNYHFLMGAKCFQDGRYSHLFRNTAAPVSGHDSASTIRTNMSVW